MNIDIFPLAHRKEGFGRDFDKVALGLLVMTYIVGAFLTAQKILGSEGDDLSCFFLAIPIFIGYYACFVLLIHFIKSALYALFKVKRSEFNSRADREEMERYISQNQNSIQKKLQKKTEISKTQANANPIPVAEIKLQATEEEMNTDDEKIVSVMPSRPTELNRAINQAHADLDQFIVQNQIYRKQLQEAKLANDAKKLDAILQYTRYSLMPHGFTDEELYQIEEAVKLLVEYNGVTHMEVLNISKKKGLKQADLKNFCWNIGNQCGIDPKITAQFALNLFYAWFSNTESSSIQKTLRNTTGRYSIEIDENIIDHLPKLKEKVLKS